MIEQTASTPGTPSGHGSGEGGGRLTCGGHLKPGRLPAAGDDAQVLAPCLRARGALRHYPLLWEPRDGL